MGRTYTHQSVILLLDEKAEDNSYIKQRFQESRFLTFEATDIFQALEDISDFTVRSRPDVVLLEVASLSEDFLFVSEMVQTSLGKDQLAIFALSDTGKIVNSKECFEGNLMQLEAELDKMIPKFAHTA